jgi:expansin (peptidoglycan-binding protein)
MLGATLGVTVAGVLAYFVMGPSPDTKADAVAAAATPVATTQVTPTTTDGTSTPKASASASPTGTPKPTASAATQAARKPARTTPPAARRTAATTSSPGRIQPGTSYTGVATAYEAKDGDGACLFGPSPDLMIAAMNTTDYETSRACGAYVLVRAANGKSVTVRITNECPLPCAPGQLDLSQQAFAKLADLKVGRLPITWSLVSPSSIGDMSIRYKTGSSAYWCGIQVIDHRNPVTGLEVRTGSGWRRLPRTDYNYFVSADGAGCGSSIRVTDIYGQQLTVSGLAVKPNVVQHTQVQFARH